MARYQIKQARNGRFLVVDMFDDMRVVEWFFMLEAAKLFVRKLAA